MWVFFSGSLHARACVQISNSLRNNKVINVIKDYGDCFRVDDFKKKKVLLISAIWQRNFLRAHWKITLTDLCQRDALSISKVYYEV
jgi:hypothetical protein